MTTTPLTIAKPIAQATSDTPNTRPDDGPIVDLPVEALDTNPFSLHIYGDPDLEIQPSRGDGLLESVQELGILVPLVVVPRDARHTDRYLVLSGHRRLACARRLGLERVPCLVRTPVPEDQSRRAVLDYNRQRRKTFRQMMREADALEDLHTQAARDRKTANLRQNRSTPQQPADRRNSDDRTTAPRIRSTQGRTDALVARAIGLGGKDLYRQARAVWKAALDGDVRAQVALDLLDAGTKSIYAAYKDLRRRDRLTPEVFRPTPYDHWPFRHDRAFGVPHPGDIPAQLVAQTVHYYSEPGELVVDPMAGGGVTLDVCEAMNRRCLAYDVAPVRPEISEHDVRSGYPSETRGCTLIFCDPPYHTMLRRAYGGRGVEMLGLDDWTAFLEVLARDTFATLRPGGAFAMLLANQTEKDLPPGWGYLDHVFLGYQAMLRAGFVPERRISCPMPGRYLPQHVENARRENRMLGTVRDLIVMRKPIDDKLLRSPGPIVTVAQRDGSPQANS